MADRLKDATSPYLLQHADNPVDWWQWGDEAFAAAAERDVPVLLSVGYSACHWCHVMAHESFEDEPTAALMNELLVSIKVDREERPDVDAVYMTATQAMTGQGGWPMTVFMTPQREPFFCGTYFPTDAFRQLVTGVARAWREDRDNLVARAGQIAAALAERASPPAQPALADLGQQDPAQWLAPACGAAVSKLAAEYDERRGGFGGAPKFPPSMVLEFLLRHAELDPAGEQGRQALAMAAGTAEAMARGGIYDQLAGGFARYSVDADWVVPHFEKMLYDNALLARVYAHLWRLTGSELAGRVAEQTCEFMVAELGTAQGGLASALDADSEGGEGAYYVWTRAELAAVLGEQDGAYAAELFGVTRVGTFEQGKSVLQLPDDPAELARFADVWTRLAAARSARPRPGRDDKVVAAWNGLAIAALAETGLLLDRQDFIDFAVGTAELITGTHLAGGRLARTSRDGAASPTQGVLEDYGCVAEGLIALSGVTGDAHWLAIAGQLLDTVLARFAAPDGGFYDTADDGERLIYRPSDVADGPSPSGTFAAAGALLSYAALTGSGRHRDAALAALGTVPALAPRFPRAAGWGLAVAEAAISGPAEIAIVGPAGDQARTDLHKTAMLAAPPGAVLAVGDVPAVTDGDTAGNTAPASAEHVPLLEGRGLVNGGAAAYVCRNFACQLPVTDPAELQALLGR
jgi:uncharacterized protein YyaL (SSP411 family)